MTTAAKTKAARVSKRDLFNELSEGMTALAAARKNALRSQTVTASRRTIRSLPLRGLRTR